MTVFAGIDSITALILGGNSGIGLGFVQQLLSDDRTTRLFATYRHTPSLGLTQLQTQYPDRLHLLAVDVTDEGQIKDAMQQIQQQCPQLHLVVYCVGLLHDGALQPEKGLQHLQSDRLVRYFQVNSIGAALVAKHILPLIKHGDRSIYATISAKVGSIGDNQLGGWYGYRASKAALNMLMRTVAIEYSRKSPKTIVAMLHPGTTDTPLSQPFQRNVPPEKLFSVERTVTQLLTVLSQLQPEDSGQFFSWDGSRLPW